MKQESSAHPIADAEVWRKAYNDALRECDRLRTENEKLRRFESYVCGVIAMGTQADLTVEKLPK